MPNTLAGFGQTRKTNLYHRIAPEHFRRWAFEDLSRLSIFWSQYGQGCGRGTWGGTDALGLVGLMKSRCLHAFSFLMALTSCSNEQRILEADQPVTDPVGPADPRTRQFQANAWQVAQGGRYFAWYGCDGCHGSARGPLDLANPHRRHGSSANRIYASITRHGTLGARIQPEQRWQLAAYVAQLPTLDPAMRRRQDRDQVGEARANAWPGPIL